MVGSLDPYSNCPGFQTTVRPATKCEERISQLSVIPGKKAKGITMCGHIERKDQEGRGSHCSISLHIQWALCA